METVPFPLIRAGEASEYLHVSGDIPASPNYMLRGGVEEKQVIPHTYAVRAQLAHTYIFAFTTLL